ncbi:MAG TPA: hypothetical protein VGI16_03335 [Candidatus Acidoferrum sp.]|jgi:predicted nucleic acid-binding protein
MIVFDASTLILIAKADLLNTILNSIGMRVAIPVEVERECCKGKKTLDGLSIEAAIKKSQIEVIAVKNRKLIFKLQDDFSLGLGEAEAIALGLAASALAVGIDDKNGIDACKLLGIPLITSIGLLVRSCEKRLLNITEAQSALMDMARYGRYKPSIIQAAMLRIEALK